MQIVLATTARQRGGSWRHIEDLGVELRLRGHEVTVALLPAARELHVAATSAQLAWRPLPRMLRRRADVWHLHLHDTFEPSSLRVLALRRPFGAALVTEHLPRTPGSDRELAPGARHGLTGEVARSAFKRGQVALAARTVVPSHGAARFMHRRYRLSAHDVAVVHHGVSGFPAAVPPLAGDGLDVVSIGALIEQKGLDVLVAAARRSRHPWRVTIVGGGPLRAQLERTAAAAVGPRRARFAGWTEDPSRYLRDSHVLCMPSRYESFGYAAAEAAAWGRPAVASLVDGLDEVVVSGRTGILVPPGDPDALAGALDGLWEDRDRLVALGRAAREHVREHFTIERSVDALMAVYEDVAGRRS